MASFAFPPLLSPLEHARSTLPPVLRTEPFFAWVQSLVQPFADTDAALAGYVSGLAYPYLATGEALAALGSWVDEPQGGLEELEWRRLILCAIAGGVSRRTWTRATARALVAGLVQSDEVTVETMSAGWVRWRAPLVWTPSHVWLMRASQTLARGVPDGIMFQATLAPPGAMVWDGEPGWTTGLWSATLSRGVV